jgi:hypothetical protein
VQVDPIKPNLKAPGCWNQAPETKMWMNCCQNFILRRYTEATTHDTVNANTSTCSGYDAVNKVGRCRLTLSNPR